MCVNTKRALHAKKCVLKSACFARKSTHFSRTLQVILSLLPVMRFCEKSSTFLCQAQILSMCVRSTHLCVARTTHKVKHFLCQVIFLCFLEIKCLTSPLRCDIIGGALARSSLVRSQARLSVSNKLLTLHVRATMRSRCVAP